MLCDARAERILRFRGLAKLVKVEGGNLTEDVCEYLAACAAREDVGAQDLHAAEAIEQVVVGALKELEGRDVNLFLLAASGKRRGCVPPTCVKLFLRAGEARLVGVRRIGQRAADACSCRSLDGSASHSQRLPCSLRPHGVSSEFRALALECSYA